MGGILSNIKNEIRKSGVSKGKFIFFKEDAKVRLRFLTDLEDGMEVPFHDSFQEGINLPCQEIFSRECKYCEMEELRTRNQYIWSVWDYDSKEVKLLMAAVNNCSPVPTLVALYETYGTLKDRDFIITRKGKQQNTSYAIVPMDKEKFRNSKAKPLSESTILKLLDKAYPDEEREDEEEDDDVEEGTKSRKGNRKKSSSANGKKSSNKKRKSEEQDNSEEYEDMTAKELYELCLEYGLEVPKRKSEEYYMKKLKEWEEESEEESDDEWEDEEDDEDDSEDEWRD